jgi:hypothetical protein
MKCYSAKIFSPVYIGLDMVIVTKLAQITRGLWFNYILILLEETSITGIEKKGKYQNWNSTWLEYYSN